jgi:toxin ParE1/3/4
LRPSAETDLIERTKYYRVEGGDELGSSFFDAAISALRAIEKMPGAGSPRAGELFEVTGLRIRRIAGFPCGWFYFVRAEYVDIVRLLSSTQDLHAILADLDLA